jgi:hypothetical protein
VAIESDEHGKFDPNANSKTPVAVMIQTRTHRIHGNINLRQEQQIMVELDLPEKFLAVTDAVIYLPDGHILYQAKFMAVQKDEIIWVMPDSERMESSKGIAI